MQNKDLQNPESGHTPEEAGASSAQRVALLGLLLALALLLGYVESLLPLNFGIPGVKIGLCNVVVLIVLFLFSWKEALLLSLIRVVLIGFLFGNLFSIIYGLAGACLSVAGMAILLQIGRFGLLGISAAGGVCHNIGQILVAKMVLPGLPLLWYLPVLLLAGGAAGILVGLFSFTLLRRLRKDDRREKI